MSEWTELALSVVGYTAGDGSYEALVAYGETEARAAEMAKMSGCGLVVRGLLARWLERQDLPLPASLAAPYSPGLVMGILLGLAHRAGAELQGTADPEPGDILFLGSPEHVEIYVGDGWRVAGGQRDYAGNETIHCVSRGSIAPAPAVPSAALSPRPVLYVLRASSLLDYLAGGGG